MCVLCRMIQKEQLSIREIAKAYREVSQIDPDHDREILELLEEKNKFEEVFDHLFEMEYYRRHGNGD